MPALSVQQVRLHLKALPNWSKRAQTIQRTFKFAGFLASIDFVNRIAREAQAANHHPEIDIRFDKVTVTLTTHDAGGITQKDFSLAQQCDAIFSRLFASQQSPHPLMMVKQAVTDHPILTLLAERWSPYGFDERPVPATDIRSLFEAARWAASSYNEQPWNYLVATKDNPQEFGRLLACLVEANQAWAKAAPVLVLCVVSLRFAKNKQDNRAAAHDLGLAAGNLLVEATARGLSVHQMIGILPDKARELYQIPEHYEAWTAMAIGYKADPTKLVDALKERDLTPRQRRPLGKFVFTGQWGQPSPLVLKHDA